MKGSTPTQISEIIIKLIKDMAAVSFLASDDSSSELSRGLIDTENSLLCQINKSTLLVFKALFKNYI